MSEERRIDVGELYKIAVDEEHSELEAHHKRFAFFVGALSALILSTLAGLRFAEQWFEYLALSIVPTFTFFLCYTAEEVSGQFYERFLAAVTMRAKIEQYLRLTHKNHLNYPDTESDRDYWADEPFVSTRNLRSRYNDSEHISSANSSAIWTANMMQAGYHGSVVRFLKLIRILAIGLAAIVIAIGVAKFNEPDDSSAHSSEAIQSSRSDSSSVLIYKTHAKQKTASNEAHFDQLFIGPKI